SRTRRFSSSCAVPRAPPPHPSPPARARRRSARCVHGRHRSLAGRPQRRVPRPAPPPPARAPRARRRAPLCASRPCAAPRGRPRPAAERQVDGARRAGAGVETPKKDKPPDSSSGSRNRPVLPFSTAVQCAREILCEQIKLAKPDDLAFLERQVDYIARLIVDRLYLRELPSE